MTIFSRSRDWSIIYYPVASGGTILADSDRGGARKFTIFHLTIREPVVICHLGCPRGRGGNGGMKGDSGTKKVSTEGYQMCTDGIPRPMVLFALPMPRVRPVTRRPGCRGPKSLAPLRSRAPQFLRRASVRADKLWTGKLRGPRNGQGHLLPQI